MAANRDEFYARPATSVHHWADGSDILAGRDLSAGGTWLGVTQRGRFATVTNFAEDQPGDESPKSRGELVTGFLTSGQSAHHYAHQIQGADYRGFNLLIFDGAQLVYTSNRGHTEDLAPGVYGLANAELGATWPKVIRGTRALSLDRADASTQAGSAQSTSSLINLLADEFVPPDEELPHRGRPIELERRAAPCFLRGDEYGTRASTALIMGSDRITLTEQSYGPQGVPGERVEFAFPIQS